MTRSTDDSPALSARPSVVLKHTYIAFGCGLLISLFIVAVAIAFYHSPQRNNEHFVWIGIALAALNPLITGIGGYAMDRALARERSQAAMTRTIDRDRERMRLEYREYLDMTPGVILRSHLDAAGDLRVDWVNQSGLDLFRISMEQANGRKIFDFVHEKDRAAVEAHARGILKEVIRSSVEFRALTEDGRTITVVSRSVPIKDGGRIVGLHTMISDLTEFRAKDAALKEERARLERMQRISHTGSWEYDIASGTITASVNAFQIYGLPLNPDFRLPLQSIREVNLEPERVAKAMGELIENNRPYDIVFEINRHGERRIIHSIAELIRREDGKPSKVVGSIQDITDRVRLERQVAAAQKDRILNTLAAGIAHDFNNVLAAILGNLEMIEGDADTDRASTISRNHNRELLQEIRRATLRGKEMTRALLAFARGEPDQNKHAIDLQEVIAEVVALLSRSIGRNISIRTEYGPELFTIDGIASEMHQVLMNLCVNASEAMQGGGILRIGLHRMPNDIASDRGQHGGLRSGDYLKLVIEDNGPGIPTGLLDKIFEPFFTTKCQQHPDRKTGTGLGLATVRNIVDRHGGNITVASALGAGTTFTILLPKGTLAAEVAKRPSTPYGPAGRCTMLVVDDEEPVRIMLKRMLSSLGYDVLCAEDGLKGIDLFKEHPEIGIVLLDSSMPKLNGEETFHRLRAIRKCKIVISSGNLDPGTRTQLMSLGLDGVLEKPYDKDTLLQCLRSLA